MVANRGNAGSTLRVFDITFTLNSASFGSALSVSSNETGALVVENSAFFVNTAGNYGAVYLTGNDSSGTASITNSTIVNWKFLTENSSAFIG